MDFDINREITLLLVSRSAIQLVCLFDVKLLVLFHSVTKNLRYLRHFSMIKFIPSSNIVMFSCTIKDKVLAKDANPL